MSFNNTDSPFDIDESLRIGELIHPSARMGMFITREVKDDWADPGLTQDGMISGESTMYEGYRNGVVEKNWKWIDAYGYHFGGYRPQGASARLYRTFTIVKRTDIATPRLFAVMKRDRSENKEYMSVGLNILRHDESFTTAEQKYAGRYNPHKENIWVTFGLGEVRVTNISTLTSSNFPFPLDIVSFSFRTCKIRVQSLSWLETLTSRERLKGGAARPPRYNTYEIKSS